jgi:DNA-directed RNA polymerase specialized sigma subunit, sigma24 homolog
LSIVFGEHFYDEDIVQETYLMLLKWSSDEKLVNNGKLNKAYIWLALKNTFLQHVRKENKIRFAV